MVPGKGEGESNAHYEVPVDNHGNHPVAVELTPHDPEDDLEFRLERSRVDLNPGTAAFVRMRGQPKKRVLRGQPLRHPFRVVVQPEGRESFPVEGTMVQRQLLPKWLLPLLAALLAFALVLVALWFTVL